jgi:hypothetical protein
MSLKPITERSTDRVCFLVIGKYGLGKTSLLRTMLGQEFRDGKWTQIENPPVEKICVLSAESGLLAVRDLVKQGLVEGYEIGSQHEFKEAYQLLAAAPEMKSRYSWVFIDSLTEISARCDQVMREKYPDRAKTFARWDDYYATIQLAIKGFRDLNDYSVVFTCLETIEKDDNNRRYTAPDVVGKGLKEKLPSFFDEVLYMALHPDKEGKEHRVFYTQPVNEYPAKDRSGKLNTIEQPNLLHIRRKIIGG